MFFPCGHLRGRSPRVEELRKHRQKKNRTQKFPDISQHDIDMYPWINTYDDSKLGRNSNYYTISQYIRKNIDFENSKFDYPNIIFSHST